MLSASQSGRLRLLRQAYMARDRILVVYEYGASYMMVKPVLASVDRIDSAIARHDCQVA